MSDPSAPWGGADDGRDLVAGSLRGYRTWHLLPRRIPLAPGMLPLSSVTRLVTWSPELRASCTSADAQSSPSASAAAVAAHRSPAPECSCGIYAWYTPTQATTLSGGVFGAVEASGLVLLGTHGFRTERARISAIATRNRRLTAACTEAGIPVYRRRRDLVAAHPPEDVSTLLGEAPSHVGHRRPFSAMICVAVWLRAALLALAAGFLPATAVIASVVVSEIALIALVLVYLRATTAGADGGASAAGAAAPPP